MATLRIAAIEGATTVFLVSLGGTTGTPAGAGYALTQVTGLIHDATITGLTGPFYVVAKDDEDIELGYVTRVVMVDDSSLIDTTDSGPSAILNAAAITPIRSDIRLVNGVPFDLIEEPILTDNAATIAAFNADPPNVVVAGGGVLIPVLAGTPDRAGKSKIIAYVSETGSYSITVLSQSLAPVDVSALTLGVYFETSEKVAVAAVTSGITIGGASNNVVTFAMPSAVTTSERDLVFAIREQSSPRMIVAGGIISIQYLPSGS